MNPKRRDDLIRYFEQQQRKEPLGGFPELPSRRRIIDLQHQISILQDQLVTTQMWLVMLVVAVVAAVAVHLITMLF